MHSKIVSTVGVVYVTVAYLPSLAPSYADMCNPLCNIELFSSLHVCIQRIKHTCTCGHPQVKCHITYMQHTKTVCVMSFGMYTCNCIYVALLFYDLPSLHGYQSETSVPFVSNFICIPVASRTALHLCETGV